MLLSDVPREQIPWFPTLDKEACIGCRECFDFCKNGVFGWDEEENHPVVVQPYRCVLACNACAKLCDQDALSFPSMEEIRKMVADLEG